MANIDIKQGYVLLRAACRVGEGQSYKPQAEEFYQWAKTNYWTVNQNVIRRVFDKCFFVQDYSRAKKMLDSFAVGYNPYLDLLGTGARILKRLVLVGGVVGGCVYLFKLFIN